MILGSGRLDLGPVHLIEHVFIEISNYNLIIILQLPLTFSDHKQNKGSILRASVEYIKELKREKEKLHKLEDGQKVLDNKYQKLLFRIFVSIV